MAEIMSTRMVWNQMLWMETTTHKRNCLLIMFRNSTSDFFINWAVILLFKY